MNRDDKNMTNAGDIRRKAELEVTSRADSVTALSEIDAKRLLHELLVHQVELEMQNKELSQAYEDLNAERERYVELNKVLESRVKDRTTELERMNSELVGFCYAISHEFRAPIARLEGFGTILLEIAGKDDKEKITHCARRIVAAGRRLRTVIDALLVMSRLSRAQMQPQRLSLSDLAQQTIADLPESIDRTPIHISIAPDVTATGDRYMMEICMRILLENAVKYRSKTDEALIEFGQRIINGEKVYFVRDNGIGFDMNYAKDIFRPFCRLHTESEYEGTGVGLATVYRIIEKHNGRIWIDAKPGEGATFFFTLGVIGDGKE